MKFAALLVQLVGAGVFVSAFPTTFHDSVSRGATTGAAYFLTNEPTGNNIMVAELSSNGKISYKSAVSTRGLGGHVTGNTAPDALMSQGSIEASAAGQFVASVNPGSSTVSLFSINTQDPTKLTQVGQPVSSEGEFPISLAINKKGTQVCVLNAGQVNGVNCYTVDKSLGLIRQPNTLRLLNLASDSGPAASVAHHVAYNDANDKLVVTTVGTPGFLTIWDVSTNGTLSQNFTTVTAPTGGGGPFSLTAVPGTSAMVSADTSVGADVWDLSSLTPTLNQTAPGKSASVSFQGQVANCWSTFSSKTGNFYFIDAGASIVTEVNLDQNLKGTVVKQYPQGAGSATLDVSVASLGGNDFLYVLAANKTSIDVLSLNSPGNAKSVGSFSFASAAKSMKVTINAANVQGMATFIKA